HWLHHPLRDHAALRARHDSIESLLKENQKINSTLRGFADVERIAARIALRNARPRDLSGLRENLGLLADLRPLLPDGRLLQQLRQDLETPPDCLSLLSKAIAPEPAAMVRDGGVIADGYSAELDELRALQSNASEFLVALEKREKERTGIPNLRV